MGCSEGGGDVAVDPFCPSSCSGASRVSGSLDLGSKGDRAAISLSAADEEVGPAGSWGGESSS